MDANDLFSVAVANARQEFAYCECESPVMDIEHDAGCRRCGCAVDFSPRAELIAAALASHDARVTA